MKNIVKLAHLSWRYLWSRPLAAVLNLLVLTLGLAAITLAGAAGGHAARQGL
jgi:putative ABC transport system permease protein